MMRKRIAAALAALAVSLLAGFGIASPAAAASETNYAVDADWTGSCASPRYTPNVDGCVQSNGDDLWVKDNVANGYGVKLRWYDQDGTRTGECIDNLGQAKAWTYCNKDFTDGHDIRWSVCWDSANGWDCSDWWTTRV
ncbi:MULTISPECIES: hypothetical protein [Glycomyces]|uniref:Secreted protein n=2 Tax=Glycomyces TaxID=58113 RepID=A0A9X3PLM2_9ACTN|nr:hypothetical protein [Glycomyces lechevalierae]MDA1387756.1 hypothetical protein [Glycomyces lechevalierae]MDR7337388.1 hypothetical protein [Glycomyces lechevalierae]